MEWKPIPGTHYSASESGDIFNTSTGRILKPVERGNGYAVVVLHDRQEYVHRVVLYAFTGIVGDEANHLNRDKLDNRLCNLEWVTRKENSQHYWRSLVMEMEAAGQLRLL